MTTKNTYVASQLPREKMYLHGVQSLSSVELLALILGTGTARMHVMEVASQLLAGFGSLENIARQSPQELTARTAGIGSSKAVRLLAALELGIRALQETHEKVPLSSPLKVYEYLHPGMFHLVQEKACVLIVDTRLCLIKCHDISLGSLNQAIVHPRDVLKPVIQNSGYGFFLAHNHPSGDPAPSEADKSITERIAQAAKTMDLTFLDHIIIGKKSSAHPAFFSFSDAGLLH